MSEQTEVSFDTALMMALHADAQKELNELPTPAQLKERYPDTSRWDARLQAALHKRRPVLKRVLIAVLTLVILTNGYSDHYVLDGFERDYEQGYDDAQAFLHVYTDIMTNDFYTVSCAIVQNQNQKELFDNEHTKYRKVKMGDVEALLGEDKNTGYYLIWEDEGITHTIIGRISIKELMLVAQKIY